MTTFLEDTKGQAPMPCFHTIKIEASWDDVSTYLLPWSTKAHTMKISATNIHNTTILPSVIDLRQLELSYLEFWAVDDVFRLIASLPPTLKKLTVRGIRIYKSWPTLYLTVRLGIDLEHVETESAEDLSLLLRDNCLISLKSLRWHLFPKLVPMIRRTSSRGLPTYRPPVARMYHQRGGRNEYPEG